MRRTSGFRIDGLIFLYTIASVHSYTPLVD